jgi:CheY-like chemotaxis protein
MRHKILVIDESKLIRDYLSRKLAALGFEVVTAQNGLEGGLKLRGSPPDLIIMDYLLSRVSSVQLLEQKSQEPNFRDIPVIMLATQLTRERLMELAKFRIRKFFAKPLKIDSVIKAISEILGIALEVDSTACIVDVHFNDGILFVEVARGLNREKIELLPYKIKEVLSLYEARLPKVLIMMTDLRLAEGDSVKLHDLIAAVRSAAGTPWKGIRLLTSSEDVKKALEDMIEFSNLEIAEDITKAMDGLLGIRVSDFIEEGLSTVKQDLLQSDQAGRESELSIRMQIDTEQSGPEGEKFADSTIAIVDDDEVIRSLVRLTFSKLGCTIKEYENGRVFLDGLEKAAPDLVFLDLLMPIADGFAVLAGLSEKKSEVPVVVLSALTKKETVIKAAKAGVKSYMIKPIRPEQLIQKAAEVLKANF